MQAHAGKASFWTRPAQTRLGSLARVPASIMAPTALAQGLGRSVKWWLSGRCVEEQVDAEGLGERPEAEDKHWRDQREADAALEQYSRSAGAADKEKVAAGSARCEHKVVEEGEHGRVCQECGKVVTHPPDMPMVFESREGRKQKCVKGEEEGLWVGQTGGSSDEEEEEKGPEQAETAAPPAPPPDRGVPVAGRGLDTIPAHLAHMLLPHQERGFHFLWRNLGGPDAGGPPAGGCFLAHAMGAGKTLLVICFVCSYRSVHKGARVVVVTPKSVIKHWEREVSKCEVDLPVFTIRPETSGHRKVNRHSRRADKLRKWEAAGGVLLISPDTLGKMIMDPLKPEHGGRSRHGRPMSKEEVQLQWENRELLLKRASIVVVDEAHNLRGKGPKRSAVMLFRTVCRVFLSGTLFQNNVHELHRLCCVVRPNYLDPLAPPPGDGGGVGDKGAALAMGVDVVAKVVSPTTGEKEVIELDSDSSDGKDVAGAAARGTRRSRRLRQTKTRQERGAASPAQAAVMELEQILKGELEMNRMFKQHFPFLSGTGTGAGGQAEAAAKDEEIKRWQELTEPFVSLVTPEELNSRLPSFREYVVVVTPTAKQSALLERLAPQLQPATHLVYHQDVTRVCIHPALASARFATGHSDGDELHSAVAELEPGCDPDPADGVKTHVVLDLLWWFQKRKERVIIFCLQVLPLLLLQRMLERRLGWKAPNDVVVVLGDMDVVGRQDSIDRLNSKDNAVKVMLASTKACGEGVSLVGASRVIHLDVEWNPSVNWQATCRAYRFGQERPVHVYRLLAEGTVEVDRYECSISKHALGKRILVPDVDWIAAAAAVAGGGGGESVVEGGGPLGPLGVAAPGRKLAEEDQLLERVALKDGSVSQVWKRLEPLEKEQPVEHRLLYASSAALAAARAGEQQEQQQQLARFLSRKPSLAIEEESPAPTVAAVVTPAVTTPDDVKEKLEEPAELEPPASGKSQQVTTSRVVTTRGRPAARARRPITRNVKRRLEPSYSPRAGPNQHVVKDSQSDSQSEPESQPASAKAPPVPSCPRRTPNPAAPCRPHGRPRRAQAPVVIAANGATTQRVKAHKSLPDQDCIFLSSDDSPAPAHSRPSPGSDRSTSSESSDWRNKVRDNKVIRDKNKELATRKRKRGKPHDDACRSRRQASRQPSEDSYYARTSPASHARGGRPAGSGSSGDSSSSYSSSSTGGSRTGSGSSGYSSGSYSSSTDSTGKSSSSNMSADF